MNYPYYVIRVVSPMSYHRIESFQYREAAEAAFHSEDFRKAVHHDWPLPRFKLTLMEVIYSDLVETARMIDHE